MQTPTGGQGGTITGPTTQTPVGPGSPPQSATDILTNLTGGMAGTGAGSGVRNATEAATMQQLSSPSPYSSADVQKAYDWQGGQIDDQYALQRTQLEEDMARRGLSASTIYGGNLNDLNIGQRSAKATLANDLGQNLAQTMGQYQTNAINSGNSTANSSAGNQQNYIAQLMGYGQNAYNNDMGTATFNANQNNSYQDFLLKMLGAGYSPAGATA
jgi:hypothetical protein